MHNPLFKEDNVSLSITNSQTSSNNQINPHSNEILNRLNNSQYIKLEFPKRGCAEMCNILNTFNIYTLTSINDEHSTEGNKTFLFQGKIKPRNCVWEEVSIECKTGSSPETANDYFCRYLIKGKTYCGNFNDNCKLCCSDLILNPMTLEIAPSKFDENQSNYEISYGSIERIQKHFTGYGIRRFYGYNQNDYKYQIGDDNNALTCNMTSSYICSNKKRFLHKIIFNRNKEECGEYTFFLDNSCCDSINYFEIKFPDDADVPMKLLLIGGLLDSLVLYYISKPELQKPNARILGGNPMTTMITSVFLNLLIFVVCYSFFYSLFSKLYR